MRLDGALSQAELCTAWGQIAHWADGRDEPEAYLLLGMALARREVLERDFPRAYFNLAVAEFYAAEGALPVLRQIESAITPHHLAQGQALFAACCLDRNISSANFLTRPHGAMEAYCWHLDYRNAYYLLARMYERGEGVSMNRGRAWSYYCIAKHFGCGEASEKLERIEQELSEIELFAAVRFVNELGRERGYDGPILDRSDSPAARS